MATDSSYQPKNISYGCIFSMIAAFLGGLALVIVAWFFLAREAPQAVPEGQGPIEAAEPPID